MSELDIQEARRFLDTWHAAYKADRVGFILRLRRAGFTVTEIGMLAGVSRERIRMLERQALKREAEDDDAK